jgi:uncharacterized protein (UPF0248 family)
VARRKSRIRQEINRILYSGHPNDYFVYYIDRPPGLGTVRLSSFKASRVIKATEWAVVLDDGETVIPLHRIVEIRDSSGRVVWSRRSRNPK